MSIPKAHHTNLTTLQIAFDNGDAALVECYRKSDGQTVTMLCAIGRDDEEFTITPFAEMVNGNPFELYNPPKENKS